MFDCEHFFDGYKHNPDYALDCVRAAHEGGAAWVVLCDTNGGTLPSEVFEIVSTVREAVPDARLGIHCHNDAGVAVANSLAAIRAGARQVQGTINGIGERCGNADLISLIPTLVLKLGYETSIAEENLPKLMQLSRMLDERLNRAPNVQAPYVGEAAFAHKGGLHASAAQKDPRTYEHVPPEKVGNSRQYLVSDQAGKSNMMASFAEFGIEVKADDPRLDKLIRVVKEREFDGWAFDSAEASFELLARRTLGEVPDYFNIGRFRVMDERRFNARGQLIVESEATTTITVGNVIYHEVALGNGPVNAVDTALRKALSSAYPSLEEVELVDYKVRILDLKEEQSGTGAITRVLIEFRTPDGTTWRTVGLSTNIIDASVVALGDGMIWKLQRDGVPGPAAAAEPDRQMSSPRSQMTPSGGVTPPVVILVRPQLGENIGAAARAMMNCGLHDMRIVAPRDGWPNPAALPMAAGGASIIENATVHDSIADAAHDLTFLAALSARRRDMPVRGTDPRRCDPRHSGAWGKGRPDVRTGAVGAG